MNTKTKTKMQPVKMLMAGLFAALLNSSPGWCHGVMGTVEEIKAYCVTAMYDDGEPMSYANVEVTAPETALPFQSGRTDRNGTFVVNADTPGPWNAVVSDGMGHRLTLNFSVLPQEDAVIPTGNNTRNTEKEMAAQLPGQNRHLKIISGLAVIFGLWGFFFAWKARRKLIRGERTQ